MKFFGYVSENETVNEDRSQEISEDNLKKMVNGRYRDSVMSFVRGDIPILRGTFTRIRKYGVTNPLKGVPRRSANTSNEYTLWMDNHSSWNKYPDRSRSIITSTYYDYAENFGEVYICLPMNGVKIGACSDQDLWISFDYATGKTNTHGMDDFNDRLHMVLEGVSGDRHFDETWDSFKSALRMFDEQIEMNGWFDVFGEIFSNYRWYDAETEMERWRRVWRDSMEATLADLLNPQKNKFNLIKAGDSVKPFKGNELWVGGPSLLIRHEEFDVRTNEFHKTREFLEDILE